MKKLLVVLVMLIAVCATARAEDIFKAEYFSGKAGFDKKIDGHLIVGDQAVTMVDNKDKTVFTIPLVTITKVSNTVETNSGAIGRKLMFGNLAEHSEGFVYVSTETADAAEAIVFRVDKKAPAGIVAKIEFGVKKAKANAAPK
jgi:hypothetical protein